MNLKFLHPCFLQGRPPKISCIHQQRPPTLAPEKLVPKNSSKLIWKFLRPCKRCFLLWKSPFSDASPPFLSAPSRIAWKSEASWTVDTIGSPHRGILCVDKIGSVAPELQEWPGTPSKPVKSTNGPFYWLTRKRAPPWWGTLWGHPCKNCLPARIRGWAGTATGGHIHVVHISHTHPPKELIQALRKYLLGKNRFEKLRISQNFWKISQILANSTNFLKKMWFWSCAKECIV